MAVLNYGKLKWESHFFYFSSSENLMSLPIIYCVCFDFICLLYSMSTCLWIGVNCLMEKDFVSRNFLKFHLLSLFSWHDGSSQQWSQWGRSWQSITVSSSSDVWWGDNHQLIPTHTADATQKGQYSLNFSTGFTYKEK